MILSNAVIIIKSVHIIAILIAFSGMLFIVNPTKADMGIIPASIALLGAIFNGFSYALVRHLGHKEKPETIIFFMALTSLAFTVPSMMINYVPLTTKDLLLLLGAGCAYSAAEILGVLAYKCAPAREISVFSYSDAILSAAFSFLIFGKLPAPIEYISYILIIAGAVILYFIIINLLKHKP